MKNDCRSPLSSLDRWSWPVNHEEFWGLSPGCSVCGAVLPDGVLKAVVRGSWEHQVGSSQLLDVAQSLELRRVHDGHQQGVELHVAVDGVVKHLSPTHRGSGLTDGRSLKVQQSLPDWTESAGNNTATRLV